MAIPTVTASPEIIYMYKTYYIYDNPWLSESNQMMWEEWDKQAKQNQANKCSVQEPTRTKNIRFLNRPA
jgi:hypothetical protein